MNFVSGHSRTLYSLSSKVKRRVTIFKQSTDHARRQSRLEVSGMMMLPVSVNLPFRHIFFKLQAVSRPSNLQTYSHHEKLLNPQEIKPN